MLFIVPLIILIVGYGFGLWFAATGRRLVRRFFFLPVLASLALTLLIAMRFEHNRLAPLPGHIGPAQADDPFHFLPLYALRVAPMALGACVIANATWYFAVMAVRRRFRKPALPEVANG